MKSVFRSTCILVLVFTAALIVTGCAKRPPIAPLAAAPEDKKIIVAKVNGTEITKFSLIDSMNRMSAINQQMSTSESQEATRKRALDQLVLQELALQEAVRQDLRVEETLLDKLMDKNIKNLGHEEGYRDYLEKQHLTSEEFRARIERGLLIQLIFAREVLAKISVPDEDVRKEYELRKGAFIAPEKTTVVDVVFNQTTDDQAAMKKANEILAKIDADKDKDPQNPAVDSAFSVRSLDLDKEKEPELYNAARKLKEGGLSGVIKAGNSLHVLRLTAYTPERQLSYEEIKGTIEGNLKAGLLNKYRQEWEQALRKDAKIEIMESGVGSR
jgi:parvulin-like peptidyl-prolyl isomerase